MLQPKPTYCEPIDYEPVDYEPLDYEPIDCEPVDYDETVQFIDELNELYEELEKETEYIDDFDFLER